MTTGRTKGFTLIELLVVISIISLLSSIILASLQGARIKARNSARLSTVQEFIKAIELYKLANGSYPPASGSGQWVGTCQSSCYFSNSTSWATNPTYTLTPYLDLTKIFVDPNTVTISSTGFGISSVYSGKFNTWMTFAVLPRNTGGPYPYNGAVNLGLISWITEGTNYQCPSPTEQVQVPFTIWSDGSNTLCGFELIDN